LRRTYCYLINGTNQIYPGGSKGKPQTVFVITTTTILPRTDPACRPSEQDENDTVLIAYKKVKVFVCAGHEQIQGSGAIVPRILTWELSRN
jgi:hypothetical protein